MTVGLRHARGAPGAVSLASPRWVGVAEGRSLADLRATSADFQLPKGARMRAVIDLKMPVGYIFDLAGAELVLGPVMPKGMTVVDVHSEGSSRAVIEMEADPVWFLAVLLFIKANWIALVIGGFLLLTLISFIRLEAPEEFVGGIKGIAQWGTILLLALVALSITGLPRVKKGAT